MQKLKIQIFLAISFLALCFLVLIQIRWMKQASELSEAQFRHRVGLALNESIDEFVRYCYDCDHSYDCPHRNSKEVPSEVNLQRDTDRLDEILKTQLNNYQIHLPYKVEVIPCKKGETVETKGNCFSLRKAMKEDEAVMNVYFQGEKSTQTKSMALMFACSIVLIIILSTFFGMTLISLFKEKRILGHTTDLINNITHEFKTPMATIALASGLLKRDRVQQATDSINHYATMIQTENNRLRNQVEQLLKLACIERGELKLNCNEVDLHEVIREIAKGVQIRVETRQGELNLLLNSQYYQVYCDSDLMQNVLVNIIDNAIKYSKDKPEITVETSCSSKELFIKISDRGIGMSREAQKCVFDRYYRESSGDVHDVKGFGIGLSYAKMIMDAHGGKITVNSKKGVGSEFTLTVPFKR
ncbi:MAG: sensor histidine kinase [Marinifilaceae bacterium]